MLKQILEELQLKDVYKAYFDTLDHMESKMSKTEFDICNEIIKGFIEYLSVASKKSKRSVDEILSQEDNYIVEPKLWEKYYKETGKNILNIDRIKDFLEGYERDYEITDYLSKYCRFIKNNSNYEKGENGTLISKFAENALYIALTNN